MIVNILMIIAGVVLVLWGADRLTDGAVALAERMQIPQIVIGLTIVALGTSAPEFCVSLVSALKGTADLAVGNVVGSNIFVDGAANVAQELGVSEAVIGLTIVAGGTSLPELATSVVAAYKGRAALAIGNVIGSNVLNISLVLGIAAVVHPMRIMGITIVDLMMMLISIGLMWLFAITKYYVSRREGWLLILSFVAYMGWLIYLL